MRTALITGGSGGIGLACARLLVERGYQVVLTARRPGPLRRAAGEVGARWVAADSPDPDSLAAAVEATRPLGLLVHAAGTMAGTFVTRETVDGFDAALREEMWAHHEPRGAQYMGLNWVGPAIMAFGTEAQKRRFLPPIAAGEVVWCQGFSEPGAGSDLAALSTRAVPDGDGFRISGQKIWTSYALMAQWCVVAARVGTTAGDRHRGITLLLVAMDRPGITVRPIASMLGPHHLNEVFFDDVWAAGDEVLGGVGNGWAVMRRALAHERVGIARYARTDRLLSEVGAAAGGLGAVGGPLRVPWARALVQARVARLLAYRAVAAQQGEAAGGAAEAGSGGPAEAGRDAPVAGAAEEHWRYAQAATIASGTAEVQRMVVARHLLGDRR